MILTCPSCGTRYFADANNLGAKGRAVRCASCSHVWRAKPDAETAAAPSAELNDDIGDISDPDAAIPAPARAAPRAKRRADGGGPKSWLQMAAVAWTGLGVAAAGLIGGAVAFRVDIVEMWPQTASAYAMVGLETVIGGLVFEDVAGEQSFSDGAQVLVVTTTVRNVTGREQRVPTVRVSLRNSQGDEVLGRMVRLEVDELGPYETTRLRTEIERPPQSALELEVRFVEAETPAEPAPGPAEGGHAGDGHAEEGHGAAASGAADHGETAEPAHDVEIEHGGDGADHEDDAQADDDHH